MNKLYSRINWENEPSTKTPLNENNLNKIDFAVDQMDDRIISLDASKFKKSEAEHLVKNIELDKATGVFTITFYSGATAKIDTLLEKLAVNFEYDPVEQRLVITLDNQEKQYIDLSTLITEYEFSESDTVAFEVSEGGEVKAKVKNGSITGEHLRPDYLADVTVEVEKAKASQAAATASAERSAASANEAKLSASAAKDSQDAAKLSEKASKESENLSASSATAAQESENNAEKSATTAATSEAKAKNSEEQAKSAQTAAAESAEAAELSKRNAAQSEANAEKWRKLSESYAHGGTGAREGEDTDSSEYWYEQAKRLAQGMNGIVNMGSKTFEQLATAEKVVNYMYNVTDAFTSDETFNTPGVYYGAGNNVVWTGEGKWDVMAASAVNGIKGNNETYFHQGNYTVSPENLKLDTFAVATQRAMVSPDDTLDVAFGKLAKYCADLKNIAFTGKYSDLSDAPSALPADGGNADTVDNKHADDFLLLSGGTLTGRTTGLVSNYHYSATGAATGYYKISINSTTNWMLAFTIRIYQTYRMTDIVVSGYNYGDQYWYQPKAIIEGDSDNQSISVTFGYDSINHLWIAIPARSYTGLDIFNVTNGYNQITDYGNLFTITNVSSLTGTAQTTITAQPPATINQIPTIPDSLPANGGTATNARVLMTRNRASFASPGSASAPSSGMVETIRGVHMTEYHNGANTGGPTAYGNTINVLGSGSGQIFCGWSSSDTGNEHLYYRSHRDSNQAQWSSWNTILDSDNYKNYFTLSNLGITASAASINNVNIGKINKFNLGTTGTFTSRASLDANTSIDLIRCDNHSAQNNDKIVNMYIDRSGSPWKLIVEDYIDGTLYKLTFKTDD